MGSLKKRIAFLEKKYLPVPSPFIYLRDYAKSDEEAIARTLREQGLTQEELGLDESTFKICLILDLNGKVDELPKDER